MNKFKLLLAFIIMATSCSAGSSNINVSDHYDGIKFSNLDKVKHADLSKVLKWNWERTKPKWPERIQFSPQKNSFDQVSNKIAVTFINHASFLIQINGVNILTDPIWSKNTGPLGLGPKRVKAPGVKFVDLPNIDLVLVSHNHYDHLDIPTLKKLRKKYNPLLITGLKTAESDIKPKIKKAKIKELDWWQSLEYKGVKITFVPAQHWSSRTILDADKTLWGGFIISASGQNLYFSGDTGFGVHFEEIHKKFPNLNVCFLPIGAYKPTWFMRSMHTSPEESVKAHQLLGCNISIAMHYGTFQLADDEYDDPEKDLKKALSSSNIPVKNFLIMEHGQQQGF